MLVKERRSPELLRGRTIRPLQRRGSHGPSMWCGTGGEIRADVDLEVADHAMVGAMFMRHILGTPESKSGSSRPVDINWNGLATKPGR